MRTLKVTLIILINLFIFGCGNTENKKETKTKKDSLIDIKTETKTIQELKIGVFENEMSKKVEFKGKLVFGKTWTDNLGENLFIFSQKEIHKSPNEGEEQLTRELHAYHYAKSEDGYKLIREVKDFTKDCGFENRAKFMANSVTITDLDEDGFAEITFAYRLGCTSELSPDVLKLLMLENGEKYAIRGDTKVQYGPNEFMGGKTNIDPSFDKAPNLFLNHAKNIWEKQQVHVQDDTVAMESTNASNPLANIIGISLNGNEPFWKLSLEKDGVHIKNMGVSIKFIPYGKISETATGWNFTVRESDVKIDVNIKKEHAYDDMSGQVYPFTAKVVLHAAGDKDKIFHGVGNYKNAKPLPAHPEKNGKFSNHNITYQDAFITLDNIKFALMADDAKILAQSISFPLRVNTAPGKSIKINNANDLEKQYHSIFTSKLKDKILSIDYKTVNDNSSGIFPKGGVVWLTEKSAKAKLFVINAK